MTKKSTGGGDWVSCEFIALMIFYCCGWGRWTHINAQSKTQYIKGTNEVRCMIVSHLCRLLRLRLWRRWEWRNLCSLNPDCLLCSRFLPRLCCAAGCLSARLSLPVSVCLSVCSRPGFYLHSLQHIHIHDGSGSLHVEMCARARACVCVCRCACVQDLIGLRSEGILRTESQVERGSRDPTVLSIMHFPLFLAPPPLPPSPRAHQRSCGDGTRRLFIMLNSVWSSANSAHICQTDFKDHRLWERYITLGFSEKKAEKKTTGCRFQDDIWFFYFSKHDGPQMPPARNETFRLLCLRLYIDVEGGEKEIFFCNSEKKVFISYVAF